MRCRRQWSDRRSQTPPEPVVPPPRAATARRHAVFHLLKVAKLDRITDDAVAITFDVPERLRDQFTYQAGQHVSVRATIAGDDVRRSYSICAPATSGVLRVGVKTAARRGVLQLRPEPSSGG